MINFLKWMKRHKIMALLLILILFALPPVGAYYICQAQLYMVDVEMAEWIHYFAAFEIVLAAFYVGGVSLWQSEIAAEKDLLFRNMTLLQRHPKPYKSVGNLFKPTDGTTIKPYVEITLRFQPQKESVPSGYILKKIDIKETLNSKSVLSGRLVYANQVVDAMLTANQTLECKIKVVDENLRKLRDSLVLTGKMIFVKETEAKQIATDYEYTAEVKFLGNTQIEVNDVILHQVKDSYFLSKK